MFSLVRKLKNKQLKKSSPVDVFVTLNILEIFIGAFFNYSAISFRTMAYLLSS